MLVLSRKLGEVLQIGPDIKLTVLEARGNQVRLGIDAPKDIKIWRDDIKEKDPRPEPVPSE